MKKRILSILLVSMITFLFTACAEGGTGTSQGRNENDETDVANSVSKAVGDQRREGTDSHILVAYFSMAGEQYVVGNIEKGNTQIIAEMIARQTGADLFQIQPVTPYPDTYAKLLEVSQQESLENPPEIADAVENMEQYDTLFIGSPVWWGDLPAIVSGFLTEYDLSGKTVIPFCTHEGSGIGGIQRTVEELLPGAEIIEGFGIQGETAQNSQDEAQQEVTQWLDDNGFLS